MRIDRRTFEKYLLYFAGIACIVCGILVLFIFGDARMNIFNTTLEYDADMIVPLNIGLIGAIFGTLIGLLIVMYTRNHYSIGDI